MAALALVGLPLRPSDVKLRRSPQLKSCGHCGVRCCCSPVRHDEYCPPDELRAYGEGVAEVVIVDGVDHYLAKKEREAAAILGDFAERFLGSTSMMIRDTMRHMADRTAGT